MKSTLNILLATLFIIVLTQFSWTPKINAVDIPVTGQSLAILLVGYILPIRQSLISVIIYILLGILGLPVFADSNSGFDTILGNSGGFIIGFIWGVIGIGYWSIKRQNTYIHAILGMLLGTLIILCCGVLRLTLNFGLSFAMEYGFYPFWIGAVVKILVGGVLGKWLKDYIHYKGYSTFIK